MLISNLSTRFVLQEDENDVFFDLVLSLNSGINLHHAIWMMRQYYALDICN